MACKDRNLFMFLWFTDHSRFLWVALQIECICAEKTYESIRQALDDLPKDLSAGFVRILQKAKQKGRCYQKDILKIVVGAYRPLQAAELRDALSVAPGDASWYPEKMINNIYTTLQCCGCLVVVDEEELTVRLIHQSVAQFLLEETEESEGLHSLLDKQRIT